MFPQNTVWETTGFPLAKILPFTLMKFLESFDEGNDVFDHRFKFRYELRELFLNVHDHQSYTFGTGQ